MGTFLIFFLGMVVIAGLLFLLATVVFGRGEEMAPMPADSTPVELPDDRRVLGSDVRALRFSLAVRGYRMREVDWVLEHLAGALDERDREIARLTHGDEADPVDEGPPHEHGGAVRG